MQNNLLTELSDIYNSSKAGNTSVFNPNSPSPSGSIFGSNGFGLNTGTLNILGNGIDGLGQLARLYFGSKQLGLAEDQLEANIDFGNRNIANQAQTINRSLEARYRAALSARGQGLDGQNLSGSGPASESLDSYLARNKVDGSPVGGG